MKWEEIRLSLIEKLKETYEDVACGFKKPIAPDQVYLDDDEVHILTDEEKYHMESEAGITFNFVSNQKKVAFRVTINDWLIALEDWKEFTVFDRENTLHVLSPVHSVGILHAFDSFLKEVSKESMESKSDIMSNAFSDELFLSVLELLEKVAAENKIELIALSKHLSMNNFLASNGFRKPTFMENGISSYLLKRKELHDYFIKSIDKRGVFHQLNAWHNALLTIVDELKKETPTISLSLGNELPSYARNLTFYHNGVNRQWSILLTNEMIQLTNMYEGNVAYEDVLIDFDKKKLKTFLMDTCHKINEDQQALPPATRYFDKLMDEMIRFDKAKNEIYQALLTYYEPASLENKIALNFEEKIPLMLTETRVESSPVHYVKVANHYVVIELNKNKTKWRLFESKEDSLKFFQQICEDELKKKLRIAEII